ncbi:hypothetical protein [Cryobacterium fucosi]|uniref:hypothetical protein n=1 Tax=Cryobacterium fucosi TaxID=1259157 RepID=UPI003B97107E
MLTQAVLRHAMLRHAMLTQAVLRQAAFRDAVSGVAAQGEVAQGGAASSGSPSFRARPSPCGRRPSAGTGWQQTFSTPRPWAHSACYRSLQSQG